MKIRVACVIVLACAIGSAASGATFSVTSAGDSGAGTLRQAILDANATPGRDTIVFVSTLLTTGSALPEITDPVDIDGRLPDASRVQILAFARAFFFANASDGSTMQEVAIRTVGSSTAVQIGDGVSDVQIFRNDVRGRVFISGDRTMVGVGNFFDDWVVLDGGDSNVVSGNQLIAGVIIQFGSNHRVSGNTMRDIWVMQSAAPILENNVLNVTVCPLCQGIAVSEPTGIAPGVIRGNTITGGLVGIRANGGPSIVQDNVIIGSVTGIRVTGTPVTLSRNLITGGQLAIDLGFDGPTPNDPAPDLDVGANNHQNSPSLISARRSPGAVTLSGSLSSATSTPYTIEFFSSFAVDPKARTFIGSIDVTTDDAGNAHFDAIFASNVPATGEVITATATNQSTQATLGNAPFDTSELSAPIHVSNAESIPTMSNLGLAVLAFSFAAIALLRGRVV